MKKNDNNKTKQPGSGVNPQGYTEDAADQRPHSELEQRAKKKNTKI